MTDNDKTIQQLLEQLESYDSRELTRALESRRRDFGKMSPEEEQEYYSKTRKIERLFSDPRAPEMKTIRRMDLPDLDLPPIKTLPDIPDRRDFRKMSPEEEREYYSKTKSIERMDLLEKPRFMEPLGELPIGRTKFPEVPRMESRSFDVPEATLKPSLPRLSDLLKPFVKVDAEEYVEAEQERKKRQRMVDAQDAFDFSSLSEK